MNSHKSDKIDENTQSKAGLGNTSRASSLPKLNLLSLKKGSRSVDLKVKYSRALNVLAMRDRSISQLDHQELKKKLENPPESEKAENQDNLESKDQSIERSKEVNHLQELYGPKSIDPTLSNTEVEFRIETLKYERVKGRRQREYEQTIRNEWRDYEERKIEKEIRKGLNLTEKEYKLKEEQKLIRKREIERKRRNLEGKISRLQERVQEKHKITKMWDKAYNEFQDLKPLHHLREDQRQKRLEKERKKFEDEENQHFQAIKAKFQKNQSKDTESQEEKSKREDTHSDTKSKRAVSSQNVRWKLDDERPQSSFKISAEPKLNSETPKTKDGASAFRSKTPMSREGVVKSKEDKSHEKNVKSYEKIPSYSQLPKSRQRTPYSREGISGIIKKRDSTPKKVKKREFLNESNKKSRSPTMLSRIKVPVQFPSIYKEITSRSNRESFIIDSSKASEMQDLQTINSQRELRHRYAQYIKDQFGVIERKDSKSPKSKRTIYQILNSIYQVEEPGSKKENSSKTQDYRVQENIWEFAKKDFLHKQQKKAIGRSESVGKLRQEQESFSMLPMDLASQRSTIVASKRHLNDKIFQKMDSLSGTISTYQNEIGFKKIYQISKKIG